ncbi:class I SAM-dependent methyltransferase [Litoribaculum gwangyangense]|uniref:Methyltransferase domain-containing protein n=1 Tax=Litoribaculum gwangyangense TaxID=1130722 RepID=A0ABP9CVP1_9FLAO
MKIVQKVKTRLKYSLGVFFIFLQPKYANNLFEKSISFNMRLPLKDRLMREVLLKKYKNRKDFETLSKIHKNYWTNRGNEYFSSQYNNKTLEGFFIPECSFILDILEKKIESVNEKYTTLVEIGTGDGSVLKYLSNRFPAINKFIGIDLSESQIYHNKEKFKNNKNLEFISNDGVEWIKENGQSNSIILTSRGVLEYFTQDRLEELFKELSTIGKIIFIAIEPTATNHDFSINPNSQIYGYENSFSHNYAQLFEDCGFTIWHQSKKLFSPEIYFNFFGAETN